MKTHFADFEDNHDKNMNGNKAAGSRARKAVGEMKKLVTAYRKASVAGE
ncbi:MAG: histone H1 [Candidatus Marinimicrobia bacterium]|nr:histone H1 [Candidatus Neomarinimicrobiota bacterium]